MEMMCANYEEASRIFVHFMPSDLYKSVKILVSFRIGRNLRFKEGV